jgi:hypothetical protein
MLAAVARRMVRSHPQSASPAAGKGQSCLQRQPLTLGVEAGLAERHHTGVNVYPTWISLAVTQHFVRAGGLGGSGESTCFMCRGLVQAVQKAGRCFQEWAASQAARSAGP